jgi:hypothetical protein
VLGGTGAVALVAAGVFLGVSLALRTDANKTCDPSTNACTTQHGVDARASAVAYGDVATALSISGAALLAAGVVVWLASPSPGGSPAVGVSLAQGAQRVPGASLVGAF